AVVVLPQPDSPTSASVSPRLTLKDTSSTARTWPTVLRRKPLWMGKNLRSCFTSSSDSGAMLVALPPAGSASTRGDISLVIEEATDRLAAMRPEPGFECLALARHEARATRVEGAARRSIVRMRNPPANGRQLAARLVTQAGDGAQQRARVRVARIEK